MHVAGVVLMLGVYDGCIQVFTLCLCLSNLCICQVYFLQL